MSERAEPARTYLLILDEREAVDRVLEHQRTVFPATRSAELESADIRLLVGKLDKVAGEPKKPAPEYVEKARETVAR